MRALIALLPGDGVGPEVVAQGSRVLAAVARRFGHQFDTREAPIGGIAIDGSGIPLPPATLDLCQTADAILLGAVGGPRWDPSSPVRPEQGLLELRKSLGLFANLRPAAPHPRLALASPLKPEVIRGVDLVFVRELTGGIYFGEKRREPGYALDVCQYSAGEIERVVRVAASLARQRRHKLTSVDKANVLETSRLWRTVTARVMKEEFPDVELEHLLVDACAMHLLTRPSSFDVLVTENMFGDILTDEASVLCGALGLLPSASLGSGRRGLYEPVHGSAPDIAGLGVANPYGTLLSVALLLRHSLQLEKEARAVERAVAAALDREVFTADLIRDQGQASGPPASRGKANGRGATTAEAGNAVLEALEEVRA
jgi:3-isopropylmalate dehydrogenase